MGAEDREGRRPPHSDTPPAPLPAAPRAETEAPRFCRTVTPSSGSERATPASSQAIRAARPCRPLFHPRPAHLRAGETSQRPEPSRGGTSHMMAPAQDGRRPLRSGLQTWRGTGQRASTGGRLAHGAARSPPRCLRPGVQMCRGACVCAHARVRGPCGDGTKRGQRKHGIPAHIVSLTPANSKQNFNGVQRNTGAPCRCALQPPTSSLHILTAKRGGSVNPHSSWGDVRQRLPKLSLRVP